MQIKTIQFPANPGKKGRSLVQMSAQTIAEAMEISWTNVRAPYLVIFEQMNPAGNHYHNHKYELIMIARGSARITLEDIETKERTSIVVTTDAAQQTPTGVIIPVRTAHVVEPLSADATLLVWATHPARQVEDDHDYILIEHTLNQSTPVNTLS